MHPLEWLLLSALFGVAGGYGGRAWATWGERRARALLADQLDFLVVRFTALKQAVDEQLDGFNRRIAKREGEVGQQRKKANAREEDEIVKALEAAVANEKGRKPRRSRDPDEPDPEEIEEALRNLAAKEQTNGAA